MNFTKFFSVAIAMLFVIGFSSASTFATANTTFAAPLTSSTVTKVLGDGGPRDIIQTLTTITVIQPEQENLSIVIVNSSDQVVLQTESNLLETIISIKTLVAGSYTVQTNCPHNDYQEFHITIE